MAPVTTVAEAAAAVAAGARLADAGRDSALVPAIRQAVDGVLVCGEHETADVVRDPGLAARTEAVAAVCVWLGARVLRTPYVAEVRRSADMTESILGRRPPAWAIRGLA
jgi:hypothetical protein